MTGPPLAGTSTAQPAADAPSTSPTRRAWRWVRSPQAAVVVFAAALVVGCLLQFRGWSLLWFFGDEWILLSRFSAEATVGPFEPHNGHLIALPWLIFRALFAVFGISTYLPYFAVGVAMHAAVVILLRLILRRAGVSPWLATVFAATAILFGPGDENIRLPFQITLTGALALGMLQLIVADHEGHSRKRDVTALLLGAMGLMFSGLYLAMIPIVAVTIVLRRGWRAAAWQTVPLLGMYVLWRAIYNESVGTPPPVWDTFPDWVNGAAYAGSWALGVAAPLTVILGVATLCGYFTSWRGRSLRANARQDAIPLGFLAGYVAFVVTTFMSRSYLGADGALAPRYLYVYLVLAIPVVAPGIDRLVSRYTYALPVVLIPLLAIGWNAAHGTDVTAPRDGPRPADTQALIGMPGLSSAPPQLRPDDRFLGHPGVTIQWLREVRDSGNYQMDTQPLSDAPRRTIAPVWRGLPAAIIEPWQD